MAHLPVGLTTHNLENDFVVAQLMSMIEAGVPPDFIIFHQQVLKRRLLDWITKRTPSDARDKIRAALKQAEIFNVRDINSHKAQELLSEKECAVIVCNSGLLRKRVLNENPGIIFLNHHCSRLPDYRGVNNIEWAVWEGRPVYGTILRISSGIDEGDILYQTELTTELTSCRSFGQYRHECMKELFGHTGKALSLFFDDKASFIAQQHIEGPLRQYYTMHPLIKNKMLSRLGFQE